MRAGDEACETSELHQETAAVMARHGQAATFFLIEHLKRTFPLVLLVPVLVAVSSEVIDFASSLDVDPRRGRFRCHDFALIQQSLPVAIIH